LLHTAHNVTIIYNVRLVEMLEGCHTTAWWWDTKLQTVPPVWRQG